MLNRVAAVGRAVVLSGIWTSLAGIGAHAQPVYVAPGYVGPGAIAPGYGEPGLPPYAIMSIVRSTGLTPLTRPMRRGPNYVLIAIDRSGRQMRVVVDARAGEIVNMRPALATAPSYYGAYGPTPYGAPVYGAPVYGAPTYGAPGYGAPAPYGQTLAPPEAPLAAMPPAEAAPPAAPPPPRANPKLANAPANIVSIPDPPAPPLPRPRPAIASIGTSQAPAATQPAAAAKTATPGSRPPPGPADPSLIE